MSSPRTSKKDERRRKAKTAFLNFKQKVSQAKRIVDQFEEKKDKVDQWLDVINELRKILREYGYELPPELEKSLDEISKYSNMYEELKGGSFDSLLDKLDEASRALSGVPPPPSPILKIIIIIAAVVAVGSGIGFTMLPPDQEQQPPIIFSTPDRPVLTFPIGIIRDQPTQFNWNDASHTRPVTYNIEIQKEGSPKQTHDGLRVSNFVPSSPIEPGDYTWKVKTIDDQGQTSGWTEAIFSYYSIPAETPPKPILRFPIGTVSEQPTQFNWDDVSHSRPVTYTLEIQPGNLPKQTHAGLQTSSYFPNLIQPGEYTWRVKTVNDQGKSSGWAETSFTYQIILPSPPDPPLGKPNLQSPFNNEVTSDNTPAFDWSDVTHPSGVTYTIDIFKSGARIGGTTGLPISQWISPALADATYTWKVTAYSGSGKSNPSSTYTFVVSTGIPAPILQSPSNNVMTNDNTPAFDWSDVTHPSGVTYTIDIFKSGARIGGTTGLSSSQWISPALADGTYTWKVTARNGLGVQSPSKTNIFTVSIGIPAPNNQSPSNNAMTNDNTPAFDWSNVSHPSGITYTVSIYKSGNLVTDKSGLSASQWTSIPLADGKYTWGVIARNGLGTYSNPSSSFIFTIDTIAPQAPASLSKNNEWPPTFSWKSVFDINPITYQFSISTPEDDTIVGSTSATSFTPQGLPVACGMYFWEVTAVDAAGNKSPTSNSSFTYVC